MITPGRARIVALVSLLPLAISACAHPPSPPAPMSQPPRSCFLLHEVGVGRVVRAPSDGCAIRVTPASTFKIPHALAALDAKVVTPEEVFPYDGRPLPQESWRHPQTMATALRVSALWYFQALARRLGPERERAYLQKLGYGNADSSSGLETFWLYQSLAISPDEQEQFLLRLYADALPIDRHAQGVVRALLVQPAGVVVNAIGAHPFGQPWPAGTVVSAKTGSASEEGRPDVRWLVGHVRRGSRSWIFVSNVVGDDLPPLSAVDLAAEALKKAGVL
jgi:beta-lactamase class D